MVSTGRKIIRWKLVHIPIFLGTIHAHGVVRCCIDIPNLRRCSERPESHESYDQSRE